jgi:hypothetical protein
MIQTVKAKEEAEQRLSKNIRIVRKGGATLQSTRQVSGYYIQAQDGEIGHVEDFIIDDDGWTISYLVIDTVNWLPGKIGPMKNNCTNIMTGQDTGASRELMLKIGSKSRFLILQQAAGL